MNDTKSMMMEAKEKSVYSGLKFELKGDPHIQEYRLNDELLDPVDSQKVYNHSPDGFNHGYGGSGPAQLALAIMLKLINDPALAQEHYHEFKWGVVSRLPAHERFHVKCAYVNGEWLITDNN